MSNQGVFYLVYSNIICIFVRKCIMNNLQGMYVGILIFVGFVVVLNILNKYIEKKSR